MAEPGLARALLVALLVALLGPGARAYGTYEERELVPAYGIKVGPYDNPSEAYSYFYLPFCKGEGVKADVQDEHRKKTSLGIAFDGGRRELTGFRLPFAADLGTEELCTVHPGPRDVRRLREAVLNDWFYKLEVDGLPVVGFVGHVTTDDAADGGALEDLALGRAHREPELVLYRHVTFEIHHNGPHVVEVIISTNSDTAIRVPSQGDVMDPFTYT